MLKANPSLTNRMDVAKARKSPFGGLDGVSSLRLRKDGETLYFVVSEKHMLCLYDERPFTVMDPMTGEIGERREYRLEKGESCFVRLDGTIKARLEKQAQVASPSICIDGAGWTVTALCGGPALPPATNLASLVSWTVWDESFSGTMRYATTFDAGGRDSCALDLGEVHEIARVRLNGRDLGCRLMAPYRFRIPQGTLKETGNRLEVEVTNLGANRLRWNDLSGVRWKYFMDINMVGYDCRPLDASKCPVLPSGLFGPVKIR